MAKKEQAQMPKLMGYMKASTQLTINEKLGQCFMPAVFINDQEEEIRKIESLITDYSIGGICFFHSRASAATNYEGRDNEVVYNENSSKVLGDLIQRYQNAAKYPLIIAIDAEWGLAMRVENTPQFPYAITLGAIPGQEELIHELGRHIAYDCKKAGIHWNFAPVADINLNPDNPVIGYRSFGENKREVAKKAIAIMKGMQSGGILTAAKHFPGHGDTGTDSHLGLPVIDKSLSELFEYELFPFQELIKAGVDAVMVGHLAIPALTNGRNIPASVSGEIIKDMLRRKLNFRGAVVSDALNMHSVSRLFPLKGQLEWEAFQAGNDVLCFAEHIPEGISQILSNTPGEQIEEAFKRVWHLKEKAFEATKEYPSGSFDHNDLNQRLAAASLTLAVGQSEAIKDFRQQSFSMLKIGTDVGQPFFDKIKNNGFPGQVTTISPHNSHPGEFEARGENLLIALYPPSIKPANSFGISAEIRNIINSLLERNSVVLYLFGNPYVLQLFNYERARAVLIAYQDFACFQEHAARHFLGQTEALGKLPVSLKSNLL